PLQLGDRQHQSIYSRSSWPPKGGPGVVALGVPQPFSHPCAMCRADFWCAVGDGDVVGVRCTDSETVWVQMRRAGMVVDRLVRSTSRSSSGPNPIKGDPE